MSAFTHAPEAPRTTAQRVILGLAAVAAAIVIAFVSIVVTLLVADRSAPMRTMSVTPLHSISDTCQTARPGQPC
jgi:hypothetical protein